MARASGKAARSPSSRRAWVEITRTTATSWHPAVALLAEGVGRNPFQASVLLGAKVALLAEGVGRNRSMRVVVRGKCVALLAEGVGRNKGELTAESCRQVALLAEGVGRNTSLCQDYGLFVSRPPRGGRG